MRTAPAWIGWAALAAAVTGCCRMQPPSAVDSLESTWTRLREAGRKPGPAAAPAPATVPAAEGGAVPVNPAGPPPEPIAADGAPRRPATIPIPVPPARGESPASSSEILPIVSGSPAAKPAPAGAGAPLAVAPAASAESGGDAAPLRVGASSSAAPAGKAAPLGVPSAGTASLAAGESPRLRLGSSDAPVAVADAARLEVAPAAARELGSLVRQGSFLPAPAAARPLPSPAVAPLAVGPSSSAAPSPVATSAGLSVGVAVGRGTVAAPLPAVPLPPDRDGRRGDPVAPVVGRAPGLLGPGEERDPAAVVPSRALERAAAQDAEREAARRRRDEAALREREAEAGVLRQFLRRVLRLDAPAAAPAPPDGPVSEPAR